MFLTLSPLGNYAQAEHIIVPVLGDGINVELDKVNALAAQFTRDVTIQLNSPPCNDGLERVEEHPLRSKGDAHNVTFCGDLIAQHNKFKEAEMVCML